MEYLILTDRENEATNYLPLTVIKSIEIGKLSEFTDMRKLKLKRPARVESSVMITLLNNKVYIRSNVKLEFSDFPKCNNPYSQKILDNIIKNM